MLDYLVAQDEECRLLTVGSWVSCHTQLAFERPKCYRHPFTIQSWDISIPFPDQYAMTGYGVAFPRGSKYVTPFNEKLLEYIENGKYKWECSILCQLTLKWIHGWRRCGSFTSLLVNWSLQAIQGRTPILGAAVNRAISFRLFVAPLRYRTGFSSPRSRTHLFSLYPPSSHLTDDGRLLFPDLYRKSIVRGIIYIVIVISPFLGCPDGW